ncbi:MAG: ABC transporter ATP-binding protein [Polyangiales bacterium]
MTAALEIRDLGKRYAGGLVALDGVDLTIEKGEIFALLGPNGAGKTTLISIACGIVNATSGTVQVEGHDIVQDYRTVRQKIGLVPQELSTHAFETVWSSVRFSRGVFGKPNDPKKLEEILRRLALWDKRNEKIMTLSGGMKRRVMIAKALSHEPEILFLDEPSAGVDVELRRDMWKMIRELREHGVTVILTTHYIEEAEEMSDRVGVINHGKIVVVERTSALMKKLGEKRLTVELRSSISSIPSNLKNDATTLTNDGRTISYTYNANLADNGVNAFLCNLESQGLQIADLKTEQSSLEDIFVNLVSK